MCRRVSSVLRVSAPHGREIRVFDDTMRRRVSSDLGVSGRLDVELGFLMILRVAWYHQFWGFQARPDVELGFLMILRVAGYHRFGGSRPSGRGIRVFDDTTCRRVSSVLEVSAPHGCGIRVFDDTMCRRVSSVLGGSRPHGRGIRVLMILFVAWYRRPKH